MDSSGPRGFKSSAFAVSVPLLDVWENTRQRLLRAERVTGDQWASQPPTGVFVRPNVTLTSMAGKAR